MMKTCPKCGRGTRMGVNAENQKVPVCMGCFRNVRFCECKRLYGELAA